MLFVQNVSELLGYVSICCWLGAQFPQILENTRQQSCESLALPFLFNWMLGDASNLIGCLLTHQLPFQTYLATYFCCADICLLTQYLYYGGSPKGTAPADVCAYTRSRSRSGSFARPRPRSADTSHYRTLSAMAGSVAAAAALAAQPDAHLEHRHPHSHAHTHGLGPGYGPAHAHRAGLALGHGHGSAPAETAGNGDGEVPSALSDSFHSDTARRKRVSWSQERPEQHERQMSHPRRLVSSILHPFHPSLQITARQPDGEDAEGRARGRPLQRDVDVECEGEGEGEEGPGERRAGSRASRRSAGMVFFGVWALFGFGGMMNGRYHPVMGPTTTSVGRLLTPSSSISVVPPAPTIHDASLDTPSSRSFTYLELPAIPDEGSSHVHLQSKGTTASDRIIGRIFAWLCTTLYLTSRLPQIWKNYVRKSVEGLSMLLFICAFLGNFFYVCSILSSPNIRLPPPASTEFLRETIPYLLGSGGTFIFDITIVAQSFIYKGRPPRTHLRSRGNSLLRGAALAEEHSALLRGDTLACSYADVYSKRRTGGVDDCDGG